MRIGINLPDDKLKILNALLDMLEAGFPEDIAIVACYGSYVTGVPTNVSDIDFYFIPSTPRGYQMSYQFIVDRIGYDLWPVSWERAERMANFDELLVSLIADARAVYYRNSEDMDRFNSLKHKVRELMQPPNRPILLRRAEAMPGLALGQSIGRWGNFFNQEAYGGPTDLPWGMWINGTTVHPTFLYESIVTFALFVFLWWYGKNKRKHPGELMAIYGIVYGTARFFIEGLRTDSLYFFHLRIAQLVSLVFVILGIAGLILLRRKPVEPERKRKKTKRTK